jgi:hypothetical protein
MPNRCHHHRERGRRERQESEADESESVSTNGLHVARYIQELKLGELGDLRRDCTSQLIDAKASVQQDCQCNACLSRKIEYIQVLQIREAAKRRRDSARQAIGDQIPERNRYVSVVLSTSSNQFSHIDIQLC